jgi:transcription initiation factor TFIIA large subunit
VANLPPYNYNVDNKNTVAASRAQQQLQAQYGNRAAGSISAIQDRMSQQQQQQQGQPVPPSQQQHQHYQQMPPQHQPPPQTDGPGDDDGEDYEGVLMQRSAAGTLHELGRVDVDRILHAQMAARAKTMEGGGLMLPLREATKTRGVRTGPSKGKGIAAYDGEDDDDEEDKEEDEDAINSDLDDPDDDHDEDEVDDEGLGNIMLCMYDKVQRVKNKW